MSLSTRSHRLQRGRSFALAPGGRLGTPLVLGLALLVLAACAAAPVLRFHSLLPVDVPAALPNPGPPLRLVVAPVRLPSAIDQPQWLVRRADNSLQLLEQDRWASPLADEVRAALREGLFARWAVVDGNLAPLAPGAAAAAPLADGAAPPWRLVLEVLRLEAWPGRETLLEAQWSLLPPQRTTGTAQCRFRLREPVAGDDSQALAEAHRRAVARLADDIGRQLRLMHSGGSAACAGAATS